MDESRVDKGMTTTTTTTTKVDGYTEPTVKCVERERERKRKSEGKLTERTTPVRSISPSSSCLLSFTGDGRTLVGSKAMALRTDDLTRACGAWKAFTDTAAMDSRTTLLDSFVMVVCYLSLWGGIVCMCGCVRLNCGVTCNCALVAFWNAISLPLWC